MKNKDTCRVIEIIQNATVVYTDNIQESFEVLRVIDKGVIIGRIIDGELVEYGYISKNSIKKIKGGLKRMVNKG